MGAKKKVPSTACDIESVARKHVFTSHLLILADTKAINNFMRNHKFRSRTTKLWDAVDTDTKIDWTANDLYTVHVLSAEFPDECEMLIIKVMR